MSIELRWVDESDLPKIARTRARCYAPADSDFPAMQAKLADDGRASVGDFLLAEENGEPLGTATSYAMTMWVCGRALQCQGVGWVGTIKTHRRRGGASVASAVMRETLRLARERGDVISALMPFRGSFYQRFGYGIVERRNEWTIPISILPSCDFSGVRFMRDADLPQIKKLRQRAVQQGQCDIERTDAGWKYASLAWPGGYCVVDETAGEIQSWIFVTEHKTDGKTFLRIADAAWASHAAFMRTLGWLASLGDQYSAAILMLPAEIQVNRLLSEPQLPHRLVEHAFAKVAPQTRMAIRILDHVKFLDGVAVSDAPNGQVNIAVRECEGDISRFAIEIDSGKIHASKIETAGADIEVSDVTWAAIGSGGLRSSQAAEMGLVRIDRPEHRKMLDALGGNAHPFCNEYF